MKILSPQRPISPRATRLRQFVLTALLLVLLAGCGRQPLLPVYTGEGSFDMQVLYAGGQLEEEHRAAFDMAAQRWSQVVVGDLDDSYVEARHVRQYCNGYDYTGPIDDLLLFAGVEEIDGPGAVVGAAGACIVRADGFPLVGLVIIDASDIDSLSASGDLYTVVLHELGHVLDMSLSGWQRRNLLDFDRQQCLESAHVEFTGDRAIDEYSRMGGLGRVPVENNAVPGTACSHWDYETFHSELMTGYLSNDPKLSRLTVGALADMGYQVDMGAADAYSLGDGMVRPQGLGRPIEERLLPEPVTIDELGEAVPN